MAKQAKLKEIRVEKLESGETVLVKVFECQEEKRKTKVKTRGRQTRDFDLIGEWQRQPYPAPRC